MWATSSSREHGADFLAAIGDYCNRTDTSRDVTATPAAVRPIPAAAEQPVKLSPRHYVAFAQFRDGAVVEDVMHQMSLSRTTIIDYLTLFIRHERPRSIAAWVADPLYRRIAAAARQVGTEKLKPIFLALGEQVPYDDIRLVVAHLQAAPAK